MKNSLNISDSLSHIELSHQTFLPPVHCCNVTFDPSYQQIPSIE